MISPDYVAQLRAAGIFLTTDRHQRSTATRIGQTPLLLIDEQSEDLTEEEVTLLRSFSSQFQERFHRGMAPKNPAFGYRANTVTLTKTRSQDASWKYRRMTWTDPSAWEPETGRALHELLTTKLDYDPS